MDIEFEREVLFQEVWTSPIRVLAQKYGLSDTGLRKVCVALDVPLPGRGHWAKVAAGHALATPTLPPTDGRTHFVCRPFVDEESGVRRLKNDPVLAERLAFEADPVNEVRVAEVLQRPHQLVAAAARAVREEIAGLERSRKVRERSRNPAERAEPDWSVFERPSWRAYEDRGHIMELGKDVLPMLVSIYTASRALRIWDAVIKACVARGMKLELEPRVLKVSCGGEWVKLRVSEKVDVAPAPSRAVGHQRGVRSATGVLRVFVIDGNETKFEDRPERSLDQQLNDVLRRIHRSMASQRARSIVWAEQRRRAESDRQAAGFGHTASPETRGRETDEERHPQGAHRALEAEYQAEIEGANQMTIDTKTGPQAEINRAVAELAIAIRRNAETSVNVNPAPYVTVKLASAITGLSEKAIRRKIEEGKWIDGREYRRAPDGGVFISIEGYAAWVERRGSEQ